MEEASMNSQKKIFYCKQCGNVVYDYLYGEHICCNQKMNISEIDPSKYFNTNKATEDWRNLARTDLANQGELSNKILKRYYKKQEKLLLQKQNEAWRQRVSEIENRDKTLNNNIKTFPTPPAPVVTCPYCHSTNTKKISQMSRMASIGFWGVFSKKIGKQWHCNECGSDF